MASRLQTIFTAKTSQTCASPSKQVDLTCPWTDDADLLCSIDTMIVTSIFMQLLSFTIKR